MRVKGREKREEGRGKSLKFRGMTSYRDLIVWQKINEFGNIDL
jgi:hypothetical protein